VQGYSIQTRAFWSIAKAFAEVFPYVTVWELGRADTMLIGSPSPIRADLARLEAEFAREPLRSNLAAVQLKSPQELLAQFLMDTPAVVAAAADAPVHTDDNALVEFSTPRTMFDKQVGIDLMEALNRHRGEGLDRLLQGEGGAAPAPALQDIARRVEARKHFTNGMVQAFYKQEDAAYAEYRRARQLDPHHPMLPDLLAEIRRDISVLASARKLTAAAKVVEQGLSVFPEDPDLNFLRARLLYAEGKVAEAIEHYHVALEGNPDWVDAKNDLAWALATTRDPNLRDGAKALRLAEQASKARPVAETLDTLAAALAETGQFDRAVATARQAAELARTAGQADLEREIQTRLVFYQSRQPYRER
jgi:tetratricopeptide (TPR) repeat protein